MATEKLDEQNEEIEEKTEEPLSKTAPEENRNKRKRRAALIVILALCLAFAIVLPLTLIDYSDVRSVFIPQAGEKILYAPADAGDIWKNDAYMASSVQKSVHAETSERQIDGAFSDLDSALAAFSQVSTLPYGGEVLGRYFAALISGFDGRDEGFTALFDGSFKGTVPRFFYPQKLSNVYLRCVDPGEDESTWEVRFSILDNDGMAVNYLASRDSGSARFTLIFNGKIWKIASIATIYPMN